MVCCDHEIHTNYDPVDFIRGKINVDSNWGYLDSVRKNERFLET